MSYLKEIIITAVIFNASLALAGGDVENLQEINVIPTVSPYEMGECCFENDTIFSNPNYQDNTLIINLENDFTDSYKINTYIETSAPKGGMASVMIALSDTDYITDEFNAVVFTNSRTKAVVDQVEKVSQVSTNNTIKKVSFLFDNNSNSCSVFIDDNLLICLEITGDIRYYQYFVIRSNYYANFKLYKEIPIVEEEPIEEEPIAEEPIEEEPIAEEPIEEEPIAEEPIEEEPIEEEPIEEEPIAEEPIEEEPIAEEPIEEEPIVEPIEEEPIVDEPIIEEPIEEEPTVEDTENSDPSISLEQNESEINSENNLIDSGLTIEETETEIPLFNTIVNNKWANLSVGLIISSALLFIIYMAHRAKTID